MLLCTVLRMSGTQRESKSNANKTKFEREATELKMPNRDDGEAEIPRINETASRSPIRVSGTNVGNHAKMTSRSQVRSDVSETYDSHPTVFCVLGP
jgi:hypothetical protein